MVPFVQKGKKKVGLCIEKNGWILCHAVGGYHGDIQFLWDAFLAIIKLILFTMNIFES